MSVVAEHVRVIVDASNTIESLQQERHQLASAVESTESALHGEKQYNDITDTIVGVAEALAAADTLTQVCEVIRAGVPKLFESEGATLFLVDSATSELWTPDNASPLTSSPSCSRSASPTRGRSPVSGAASPSKIPVATRLPVDKGIVGSVARTGQPVVVAEAYDDPRFHPAEKTVTKLRTVMYVPVLNASRQVVGVVQVCNKQASDGFSQTDVSLLQRIA